MSIKHYLMVKYYLFCKIFKFFYIDFFNVILIPLNNCGI